MTFSANWTTLAYYLLVAAVPALSIRYGAPPAWLISTLILSFALSRTVTWLNSRPLRAIILATATGLIVLVNCFLGASYYLQGQGVGDGLIFHLQWNTIYGVRAYWREVACLGANLLFAVIAAAWMARVSPQQRSEPWVWALLPVSLVFFTPVVQTLQYSASLSSRAQEVSSEWRPSARGGIVADGTPDRPFEEHSELAPEPDTDSSPARPSAEPWSVRVTTSPKKPLNLVMIYLEGLEQGYFDVSGLMPNLSRWREQTIRFSNVYQETPGSTMVGIVATQCGWPIFRARKPSDEDAASFLGGLRCLGDELRDAGYVNVYMGGADNRFTGKKLFFTTHGFETVLGGPELENRLADPDYQNYWGLHDDSLLELAWTEFERLSRRDAPFALVMLTLGTHVPGFIAATCPEYGESDQQMLRAIHCTDQLVYDFVQRVRSSAVSRRTAIAILSDHLMLAAQTSGANLGKRTLAFMLDIPGEKARLMEQKGTHFDVAPTILEALGFESSGRFGLGSSLMIHEGYLWSSELGFRNEVELRNFVTSREMRDFMDEQW